MIERALISVYDKSGVVDFAKELVELDIDILSTGGTARLLEEHKVKVRKVSDFTRSDEILDGRIKTLHPKIYAGLLCNRDNDDHRNQMHELEYEYIDMVIVNLYPFEEVTSKPDVTLETAIENIDIGGVTLIRAAAKNFKDVILVTDPEDYNAVLEMLKKFNKVDLKTRKTLAVKGFAKTMKYDKAIAKYLQEYQMR